jgi:hypothetical protein
MGELFPVVARCEVDVVVWPVEGEPAPSRPRLRSASLNAHCIATNWPGMHADLGNLIATDRPACNAPPIYRMSIYRIYRIYRTNAESGSI